MYRLGPNVLAILIALGRLIFLLARAELSVSIATIAEAAGPAR